MRRSFRGEEPVTAPESEGSDRIFGNVGIDGDLTPIAGSPYPAANPGSLAFGAAGKFLYAANAGGGAATILGFSVDPSSGTLTGLPGFPIVCHPSMTSPPITPARTCMRRPGPACSVTASIPKWNFKSAPRFPCCRWRQRRFREHRSNKPVSLCQEWQRWKCGRLRAERCNGRTEPHARVALCRWYVSGLHRDVLTDTFSQRSQTFMGCFWISGRVVVLVSFT